MSHTPTYNLRQYQQDGVTFLLARSRACLADEPGLGKTAQILTTIQTRNVFPVLIFAPKSALGVWRDEIEMWLGPQAAQRTCFYRGTVRQREQQRENLQRNQIQFVITAYRTGLELLEEPEGKRWRVIVCDEFHRMGLLNVKTQTYKAFKKACSRIGTQKNPTPLFYAVSGTPYTKGPQDFFGLLHLFDPRNYEFKSYWRFVYKYCNVIKNEWGYQEILPNPRNAEEFRELLSGYFLRRTKKKVLAQLPPKTRQIIPVEMSPRQAKIYEELEKDLIAQLNNKTVMTLSPLTLLIKLRQLLVSPKCLDETENNIGGGAEALLEMLELDFDSSNSALIFTPFVQGVELLANAIKQQLNAQVFKIHGKLKELPSDVAKAFQKEPTHRKILISTIKTGQAWTATDASVVYFLGYEWAAVENEQAEDRAHRIGQVKNVICKYIKHQNTVEEGILQVLMKKEMGFAACLDAARFFEILQKRFKIGGNK